MFLSFASQYPLMSSFLKFFVLASIGDVIGIRLQSTTWKLPLNAFLKAIVWGGIGVVIYLMFQIYPIGISLLQTNGMLPFSNSEIGTAFLISLLMNCTFAPTMMSFHRITDTYLNERAKGHKLSLKESVNKTDWGAFYSFLLVRTIPLFWIPAHTITFLLPDQYRILFAAILGIVLGLLLSLGQSPKPKQ